MDFSWHLHLPPCCDGQLDSSLLRGAEAPQQLDSLVLGAQCGHARGCGALAMDDLEQQPPWSQRICVPVTWPSPVLSAQQHRAGDQIARYIATTIRIIGLVNTVRLRRNNAIRRSLYS